MKLMQSILAVSLLAIATFSTAQVVYTPDFPVQQTQISTVTTDEAPSDHN